MSLNKFKSIVERQRATREAYHTVFATPEGKMVLHDLLRSGGVLQTSMVTGDAYMTAFNEGRRALATEIVHKLRWTEAEMMQLALERTGEQLADQQETG